ncbi:GNAT family N-acetyltransferase [Fodinicola feengrottensis]|uniref:GNAT family N-acetyltransferase n=1 Tax=Fodinicola feengrottensis TaxID=435914 RepID=A0ABN2GES1_9ACTN|nr:GNAT family N-acetyltransferase [Fodinicola feengrottensis]
MTIRRAGAPDVPALAEMRHEWTVEWSDGETVDDPDYRARFAAWFAAEPGRLWWVAQDGPATVGMLNMVVFTRMPRPGRPVSRWGYIANVFVRPKYRDAGAGRELLDAAIAYARDEDFARLVLSPSERSVPFYRRAGFGPADNLLRWEG